MAVRTTHVPVTCLHLCSGYGGFELGLRLAGMDVRTVAHVERESHAASVLVARMEDQALDLAPVWSDLETFPAHHWRGKVEMVTAGFPCQPFSNAGQRRGVQDERWLWPWIADIVRDVGCRYIFLENVPQLVSKGLPYVLSDLASLGFDAEWCVLGARDAGAPHKRDRFWLLGCDQHVGHTDSTRRTTIPRSSDQEEAVVRPDAGHRSHHAGEDVADTASQRRFPWHGSATRYGWPITPTERWPPPPDDHDGWRRWIDTGGPEPSIRRIVDGATGRVERRDAQQPDRLHLLGNGLVPQVAALALHVLARRLGIAERLGLAS